MYKRALGHLDDFRAPETVLVCYQRSTIEYLLKAHPELQASNAVTHLYLLEDGQVGVLGDWGVGAPGLAIKIEELIALGSKRFIAVGTAGGLMNAHEIANFVLCTKGLSKNKLNHLAASKPLQSTVANRLVLV